MDKKAMPRFCDLPNDPQLIDNRETQAFPLQELFEFAV